MENLAIGFGIVFLAFLIWGVRFRASTGLTRKENFVLPPGVTLRPRSLLNDTELLIYNLMRLAAEDHYLVFAKVPLWSVVSVEAEGPARTRVLRQIALKELDFVFVHPGTKKAEQVVLLEEGSPPQPHEVVRRREIQSVLHSAGIRMTILKPTTSYTVPQLAQLLGVSEDE
ncbi:MAG: hypothetical protein A2V62_01455 [Nitrospirae bacterium RBG_19FT_COMBO_58_9]|nr:MAG: hypothetical protein A2V62_01455 [Nitrospirae bacterium RBG_19FT_COMBO_58_9]